MICIRLWTKFLYTAKWWLNFNQCYIKSPTPLFSTLVKSTSFYLSIVLRVVMTLSMNVSTMFYCRGCKFTRGLKKSLILHIFKGGEVKGQGLSSPLDMPMPSTRNSKCSMLLKTEENRLRKLWFKICPVL